jgi:hypothetical protein
MGLADDGYFGPPQPQDMLQSRYTGGYGADPDTGGGALALRPFLAAALSLVVVLAMFPQASFGAGQRTSSVRGCSGRYHPLPQV